MSRRCPLADVCDTLASVTDTLLQLLVRVRSAMVVTEREEKPTGGHPGASGTSSGKRRIRQNVWGNWYGYEGTRRTKEFGTDARAAREWATVSVERLKSTGVIKLRNSTHPR